MNTHLFNYLLAIYISSFACFILGLFVFLKARETKLKRIFFLLSLSISVWGLFQGLASNVSTQELSGRLGRIGIAGAILIPIFFVHFVNILLNKPLSKLMKINYLISLLFLLLLFMTPLLIKGAGYHPILRFNYDPGILYPYFIIYFLLQLCWGCYKLIQAYLHSTGFRRNQIKYLAIATILGFSGGSTNFLYDFNIAIPFINPFATYLVPIYAMITTYAIVRYRLMDISVVIRKTFIYAIIYGLAIGIFSVLVIFFGQLAFYGKIDSRIIWMCIVSLLLITSIVRPLDNFLTKVTDRILFRKKYEYQKTLKNASLGMARVKSLPELLSLITDLLVNSVNVSHCAIFLKNRETDVFLIAAKMGKSALTKEIILKNSSPLILWLMEKKEALICEEIANELKRDAKTLNPDAVIRLKHIVDEMLKLNASLCIPSFIEDRMTGFILLGEKLSGDMYTQEDLDLFSTLANNAALAIENAQSYEELKDTRDQLLQSERLATIGKFANEVAHEIKNPLQALRTFIEYLPEKFNDQEFRDKFTKIAASEIERIDSVVRQLVGFSKPKLPDFAPVEIHSLIDSTLLLLENDFKKKGILLKRNYLKGEIRIKADKNQLKQAFLNLFLNSLEASEAEKPNQITIKTSVRDKVLEISIADTGCGISAEGLSHLFEPFFSTKEKGNGLGLTIVKNIIENHNGRITVESKPGTGSTFYITLPLDFDLTSASSSLNRSRL